MSEMRHGSASNRHTHDRGWRNLCAVEQKVVCMWFFIRTPSARTFGARTRPDAPAPTYRNHASMRARVPIRGLSPPHPHPANALPSQALQAPHRALSAAPAAPRPFPDAHGARIARATRGEGTRSASDSEGLDSYGCPIGSRRDDATEGGEKKCNVRSTFETSKNNSRICLKTVETLEIFF
jgi:hypothetical protein